MTDISASVKRGLALCAVAAGLQVCCIPGKAPPEPKGVRHGEISVGKDSTGEARSAFLKVPDGMDLSKKNPAVIVIHGGQGNTGRKLMPYFEGHMNADFILAFPSGQLSEPTEGGWNVRTVKDMRHLDTIERLRKKLISDYNADPDKIYATGFSGGSYMVHQLYCNRASKYAGFVGMNHYLKVEQRDHCDPDPPTPYMLMAGTRDKAAKYGGQNHPETGEPHELGAEETVRWFRRVGACKDAKPKTRPDTGDNTRVLHYRYNNCRNVSAVEFLKIEGGGHSIPTKKGKKRKDHCSDIEMSDEIISFFRREAGL